MRSEGELAKIVHQSHLYYTGVGRGEHYVRNKKYYIYFMFFFIFILLYIYIVYYYILFLIFLLGHSEFIVFGLFSFSHFINPINSVLNQDVNLCGPQLPTWPFREFFFLCTPISFLEGVIYRAQDFREKLGRIPDQVRPNFGRIWAFFRQHVLSKTVPNGDLTSGPTLLLNRANFLTYTLILFLKFRQLSQAALGWMEGTDRLPTVSQDCKKGTPATQGINVFFWVRRHRCRKFGIVPLKKNSPR